MSIYHARHSSIGRSTHAEGTAGAHVEYIIRRRSCDLVIGEHMPLPPIGSKGPKAREWMDKQEASDRKNARVIDKLTLALPHELSAEQQVELVRAFAHSVTGGAAPYLAAFHRGGKDAANQHCHLILRDRHIETGKRVWGNETIKPTEIFRACWEQECNKALERAGVDARVDRRTLAAQGIDREPTKHIGPTAQAIETKGRESWKVEAIRDEARERMVRKAALVASLLDAVIGHKGAQIVALLDAVIDHKGAQIVALLDAVIDHKVAQEAPPAPQTAPEPQEAPPAPQTAPEPQEAPPAPQTAPEPPRSAPLDPAPRAATFPTSKSRWPWERFEAMKNIPDRAARKEALAIWVVRIVEDWDGLKGRIASFWSATGRKDAAQQLETAAAEFPEIVAPLSEKIETHNAALAAEAAARRQAEIEAERIRKAELARQQGNTGLKR